MDIPVFDNHVHLQEEGENVNAVKRFEKAGGNIINICNLPLNKKIEGIDYFVEQYEKTIKIADQVRKNTGVIVLVTIGPYPVDALKLMDIKKIEEIESIFKEAIDIALNYIEERKANALGEIGRPHFTVQKEIWDMSNRIIEYAFENAGKRNIPVILHTESATEKTFKELAEMAERNGINKNLVIKHFSPPFILPEENHGIFPSVMASRENARNAILKGKRFFLETDFLDDPKRKGAVMDIESVPRRMKMLTAELREDLKEYAKVLSENISMIYGIELMDF